MMLASTTTIITTTPHTQSGRFSLGSSVLLILQETITAVSFYHVVSASV